MLTRHLAIPFLSPLSHASNCTNFHFLNLRNEHIFSSNTNDVEKLEKPNTVNYSHIDILQNKNTHEQNNSKPSALTLWDFLTFWLMIRLLFTPIVTIYCLCFNIELIQYFQKKKFAFLCLLEKQAHP